MDIRVLRYFLVVAREESFSRAADALYMSQPQIREMEDYSPHSSSIRFTTSG
jgi:DNA-binding transcriptional LysR family regulator